MYGDSYKSELFLTSPFKLSQNTMTYFLLWLSLHITYPVYGNLPATEKQLQVKNLLVRSLKMDCTLSTLTYLYDMTQIYWRMLYNVPLSTTVMESLVMLAFMII